MTSRYGFEPIEITSVGALLGFVAADAQEWGSDVVMLTHDGRAIVINGDASIVFNDEEIMNMREVEKDLHQE